MIQILNSSIPERIFLTADATKATSQKAKEMATAPYTSKTEGTTRESGSKIKCMASANFITRMERLLMKAIGKTMSSMDREEFTIWNLLTSTRTSTTRIFLNWAASGYTMMASSRTTQSMAKATSN
jgi:hypothetical protein